MDSKHIVLQGLATRYYVSAAPAGGSPSPLLFLHGWRSEAQVWQHMMQRFAQQSIRSFSLDLAGFGGSETPHAPWKLDDYAAAVSEFIDKMELSQVVLVGHSFGGRIAIKLAASRPAWLDKLVLVGSAGFRDPSVVRNLKKAAAVALKPLFAWKRLHGVREHIYSLMGASDYVATPALQQTFQHIIEEDLQACMPRIHCTTCLIWGSADRETPPAFGERMKILIPASELHIIEGAGHYSFLDKPDQFQNIILDFLNR